MTASPSASLTPQEQDLPPLQGRERLLHLLLGLLAHLPLALWRGLGIGVGVVLYYVIAARRRVALVNLALCFPHWTPAQRNRVARQHFVRFVQAALDRIWLWHGSAALLQRRLRLAGDVAAIASPPDDATPLVLFAPHFVGLDAGGMAISLHWLQRRIISIYTPQRSAASDIWSRRGRTRWGNAVVVWRRDGVKPIVKALRDAGLLYLLPDMNFGPQESIWSTFFGQPAATVPSLSRFAKLGRARVVSTISFMEPHGYTIHIQGPWADFPTADVDADTQRMNHVLEDWVRQRPHEYFWVHKRFKTRPEGMPPVY